MNERDESTNDQNLSELRADPILIVCIFFVVVVHSQLLTFTGSPTHHNINKTAFKSLFKTNMDIRKTGLINNTNSSSSNE